MRTSIMLAMALAAAPALRSGIVDRIAASVGYEVITESQVMEEIRVTAFLEGGVPDFGPDNKRKALDRLIDQALVRREVEFTRFPQPGLGEVEPLLKQVKEKDPSFLDALAKDGVTEQDVMAHLKWQLTMLRFIEYRFQPSVQVTETEIRQEYRRQAAAWREKTGAAPPDVDAMRPELEKIVRQRLTDSALDRWLGEVRTQNQILYREGYTR
jgi:hypothetical protein